MYDHIWLIDLNEEFKGMKSIIRILPEVSVKNENNDNMDMISNFNKTIKSKFDKNFNNLEERVVSFERDCRH